MHIKDPRVTFSEKDIAQLKTIRYAISLLPDRVELDPRNDEESDLLYGWAYYGMLTWALGYSFGLGVGIIVDAHTTIDEKTNTEIEDLTFCLITETGSAIIVALPGTIGGPGMFHDTSSGSGSQLFTTVAINQDTKEFPHWYKRGISDLIDAIKTRMKFVQSPVLNLLRLGEQDQPI